MRTARIRSRATSCLLFVWLGFGLLSSCTTAMPDAREDLRRSLKGADVKDYVLTVNDDDAETREALTNPAVRNVITMDRGTPNVVLRYTRVHDKKTNTRKTYRAEAVRSGNEITLVVTNVATNEVVSKRTFPAPQRHATAAGSPPTFKTLADCIGDFNCTRGGALQCEANRTCQNQFAALLCCLDNGQCISVHLVINPTSPRCQFLGVIPGLEGLVFQQ